MPVRAYVGEPRSGKTYELASVVILNALKQGRRVVSNIAGLDYSAYVELIKTENPELDNIGSIINLQHEEVKKADFWLTDTMANTERHERQLQRGDFLVLDEIWRFWDGFNRADSEGVKRPEAVLNFIRMHGQMPHPKTGLICEIALITQDIQDIHRSVKNIITQTFVTTKLSALGLTKRYRLDVYQKHYISRKPISSYQKDYNPKYFSLYKSHSAKQEGDAEAVELSTDKRGNILKGKIFLVLIVLLLLSVFAIKMLWGFFHPEPKIKLNEVPNNVENIILNGDIQKTQTAIPSAVQVDIEWRIHGYYVKDTLLFFVLVNDAGAYRYELTSDYGLLGLYMFANLDGKKYTNWQSRNNQISNNARPN